MLGWERKTLSELAGKYAEGNSHLGDYINGKWNESQEF